MPALRARPPWRPGPALAVLHRIHPGVRRIIATIDHLEREWHDEAAAALDGGHPLWVVLGDSTAQGVGAGHRSRSWVSRLAGALADDGRPHGVVNLSRSGAVVADVVRDQLPLLERLPRRPAVVTCAIGANDLVRSPWPATVGARLRELAAVLPTGTIMITLPSPAVSPSGRIANNGLRRAAADHGHVVADVVPHLVGPRRGQAEDGFHPSAHGYQAWVEAVAPHLGLDPAGIAPLDRERDAS